MFSYSIWNDTLIPQDGTQQHILSCIIFFFWWFFNVKNKPRKKKALLYAHVMQNIFSSSRVPLQCFHLWVQSMVLRDLESGKLCWDSGGTSYA